MDNFDHEENTKSGIGGSHDTILMLFQNTANEIGDKPKEISTKPLAEVEKKALDRVLDCQKLVQQKIQRKWREGKETMSDFTETCDKYKKRRKEN